MHGSYTCKVCKKLFYVIDAREYVYKRSFNGRVIFYCCYTCWRKEREKAKGGR